MKFICIVISFLFIGCASLDNTQTERITYKEYESQINKEKFSNLSLSAKITLFIEKKGFTGKLIWSTKNNESNISILNPFNSTISKVYLNKENNSLQISNLSNNKKEIESNIRKIFGNKETVFIIEQMIMNPPAQLTNTNLVTLTYKDWVINYEGIKSKGEESFPKYIELNKNEITLKIYIVDWKID